MTNANDPNSYPSYGDYNQGNESNPYGPTSGYVDPETLPESGRPLTIPAEPLPATEPVPFGFKRLFTSQWHVYVGLIFVPFLVSMVLGLAVIVPMAMNDFNSGMEDFSGPTTTAITIWQILASIASFIFGIVAYKVALRDTRGEKPQWSTAFKGVPWGQGLLAYILTGLCFGVVLVALFFLGGFLASQIPALGAVVMILTVIAGILSYPFVTMIPLYAIDGRTTATGAFAAAWNDVKANYGRVFGALILLGIVCGAISLFTFFLGMIIAIPVQLLGTVFIYRWISEYGHASLSAQNPAQNPAQQATQPYQHPENQNPQNPEDPGSGYMTMY